MKQISEFGPGELAAAVAATHKWYKSDDGYFWYERNEDDIEIFTGCTVSEYQPEVSINEAWPLINELRDLDIYLMIDQGKYGFDVATFKSSCRNCDSLGTVTVLL